jgi:hypothetical protein
MTEANTPGTRRHEDKDTVTPSEARIILGPLVKYALMGLVLAVVVLTTVVMLDHRITDINREVAALEAELAPANTYAATEDQITASQDQTSDSKPTTTRVVAAPPERAATKQSAASDPQLKPGKDAIAHSDESDNAVETAPIASETTLASTPDKKRVATTTIPTSAESAIDANTTAHKADTHQRTDPSHPVVMINQNERWLPYDQTFEAIIAERNAYFRQRDHVYLEDYKASQEKQLQLMRNRLARQEQRIKDWETHYRYMYDTREDDLMELHEIRESFMPDRI